MDSETSVSIISLTWNILKYVNEYLFREFQTLKEFVQVHNESTVEHSLRIKIMYTFIEFRVMQFKWWESQNICEEWFPIAKIITLV